MSYCDRASVASAKHPTLVDILRDRAQDQPDQLAYCFLPDGDTQALPLTYQGLDVQARSVAARLQALRMQNERVLLVCSPGLDYVVAFLGCLYAGAIAVPVYPPRPNQSSKRLQAIISNAKPKCILTTITFVTNLTGFIQNNLGLESIHYLTIDNAANEADHWRPITIQEDAIAFLQYTSGSTGNPKGVMVSHANLGHNLDIIQQQFETTSTSRGFIWLPPYHDMGLIGGILQPLYAGFTTILMSPVMFLQRPLRWLKAITHHRATVSGGPNFAYDLCVQKISPEQCDGLDLSSWEVAFTGAEPIHAATLEQFAEKFAPYGFDQKAFYPCYGLAEATLMVSGNAKSTPPTLLSVDSKALAQNQVITSPNSSSLDPEHQLIVGCGQVVSGHEIAIVHPETRTRCAPDHIGEIWIRGTSVTHGYWQQPDLTQQTFHAFLADTGEGAFLRTGDLGFLRNGELFVTGRLKDVIIIRGQNHYPTDIETTAIASHPALRCGAAAAFTIAEADGHLVIALEVERAWLRKVEVEEVTRLIRQAIAQQHDLRVHTVLLLKPGSIPKTSSGKIQRFACRQAFLEGTLSAINDPTVESMSEKPVSVIVINH